jgi:hypothetical protein
MLRMQVSLVWVARARLNKLRKVVAQISTDAIAEGDIHWIAAGAGLSICSPLTWTNGQVGRRTGWR